MSGNEQVRVEIKTFLQALASYPNRFAADPRVTFDEYHLSLVAALPTAQPESLPVRVKAKASGV
jgi:hypothetical protein